MWGEEWYAFVLSLSTVCKPVKERMVREKGDEVGHSRIKRKKTYNGGGGRRGRRSVGSTGETTGWRR